LEDSDKHSDFYYSTLLAIPLAARCAKKDEADYLQDLFEKGLFQAIESNQIFAVAFLLQMDFAPDVNHVSPRFKTPRTKGHALAFKLKRREILKLFHPERFGRDYNFYLACAECMTVEEFINTERELEDSPLVEEINRLKFELISLRQEMAKLSID